jgi:hypothetical protein
MKKIKKQMDTTVVCPVDNFLDVPFPTNNEGRNKSNNVY